MALVLNEWLFQATKPSFLIRLPALRQVAVAMNVGLALSILALVAGVVCWMAAMVVKRDLGFKIFMAGPPAAIIAITLLLMVDNFTGTLLGYNMGAATGFWRFAYVIFLFALFLEVLGRIDRLVCKPWSPGIQKSIYGLAGVWIVLSCLSVSGVQPASKGKGITPGSVTKGTGPNIIILSTDGLNASSMSVYGYPRATTPYLESLAGETLRFEDHFVNASHTTSSIVALLTGRYPTRTNVVYRPDVLTGEDAFLHLPGLLRQRGYRNFDLSLQYYADPYDLNLRNSFHQANGRQEHYVQFGKVLPLPMQIKYDNDLYFFEHLAQRIKERLSHIFGFHDLGNPYFVVTHTGSVNRLDEDTVADAVDFLQQTSQPFFLHVHLLGTHGPKFGPPNRVFSAGQNQSREWMTDFYDDAVLAFDRQVETFLDALRQRHFLETTIVIITSDHGRNFSPLQPVPLIIRFPGGTRNGIVGGPTQQIDIAPTLLDYLEIPVPPWMDGQSLLSVHYQRRPVIGVYPAALGAPKSGWREAERYHAPYYSLGGVSVITDDMWHGFSLKENCLIGRSINGTLLPSTQQQAATTGKARKAIIEHLENGGYDVTAFNSDAEVKQCENP